MVGCSILGLGVWRCLEKRLTATSSHAFLFSNIIRFKGGVRDNKQKYMNKKSLFLLLFAFCNVISWADVTINTTTFPDANFRAWIKTNIAGASDGVLTTTELSKITSINCSNKEIADLKGIGYFSSLTSLNCNYNKLTSLNLSKNTKLKTLRCDYNELTSLDLSYNTALTLLMCTHNRITDINLSKNTALIETQVAYNKLNTIDIQNCVELAIFNCGANYLKSLDISKNVKLNTLNAGYCELEQLNVSNNTQLVDLMCHHNKLSELNISKLTKLKSLRCDGNKIMQLDATNVADTLNFNGGGQEIELPAVLALIDGKAKFVVAMPDNFINNTGSKTLAIRDENYENRFGENVSVLYNYNGRDGVFFVVDRKQPNNALRYEYVINNKNQPYVTLDVIIVPQYPFVKGDMTGDFILDVSDVTALINMILGNE